MKTKPWMMLVAMMAGWINRQQQDAPGHAHKRAAQRVQTLRQGEVYAGEEIGEQ